MLKSKQTSSNVMIQDDQSARGSEADNKGMAAMTKEWQDCLGTETRLVCLEREGAREVQNNTVEPQSSAL